MADDFPFARPPYRANGGGDREVFKLRWLFQSMFKSNHANKIGLLNHFASMACYTLLESDPLRRHLRAEISFYNKPQDFVESDILPKGEFNERIEALFLASRPALAPGGTFPEMASTPQFGLHSSGTKGKREAEWDKREETLLEALAASKFNDWHTDEARRRADEKPMKWTPRDSDAKKKGGKANRAKTTKLADSVTNSEEYPGMATLTFDNTDNAQPGSSTNWAATAYPESGAPPALPTPLHPPSSLSNGGAIGDGFNNTRAFPAVTSRLAIYPDYSLHNQISGSSPGSEYSSLRVSPTSDKSWSGLRAFEPRQFVAVRGMQFTADEEMAIDTDLAIPHRLPTPPVADCALQAHPPSLSLPPPPHQSFPETLPLPTHIVPSHSPQAVAEGAWLYDEHEEAHWVPYPRGASFQPQDQGFYQYGSQWYGPAFMQQQPDSQDAPPYDAMEYEATPGWNTTLW